MQFVSSAQYVAVLIIPAFWAFAIISDQCNNKLVLTSVGGYCTTAADYADGTDSA